jgi:putative ABC transport system permease protein
MLLKKMLREMGKNFGQFISILILAFLAVSLFACMKASNISAYNKRDDLYKATNNANGFIYGENFTEDALTAIRKLDDVKDAERRLHITANAVENDQAQLEVYLLNENIVSKPFLKQGDDFDLNRTDSVWISEGFANEWGLKIGDNFSFNYNGVIVTKKIAGLVVSAEYQYLKADKDLDIVIKNISIVYMPYAGFPVKDFVKVLINNGDLTIDDAIKYSDEVREKVEKLEALGFSRESITKEDLCKAVDSIEEETILEFLPYTEIVFTTDNADVKGMEKEISDALNGEFAVFCDRDDLPGMKVMADELAQHDQFAVSFPVVFIAIALLIIMTTMNRMIAKQRTQIGTMRALGVKKRKIVLHYLSYSFIVSLIGSVLGLFIGTYVFGEAIAKIFREWYIIPGWTVEMDYTMYLVCVIVVLACVLATYLSCRKVMNIHPAESLRPAPPKSGKRTLFEKLPFWDKLGFNTQYNLRDISRGKLRAFMGVIGTAAGMIMMVSALASITTIQNVSDWTLNRIQNYKSEVDFENGISIEKAESIRSEYGGELVQAAAVEIASKKNAASTEKMSTTLMVTEGKDFYRLTDINEKPTSLAPGTVAITMKQADKLGLKVGDKVYWHLYEKNTWYEAEIGLINRHPNLTGITMLRADYEKTGENYAPSVLYTDNDMTGFMKKEGDGVLAVHDDADIRESFDVMMSMIYAMLAVFVIFAAVLPIVVLYNCGNLSFNERVQEFATLKVMGLSTKRIRRLLALQNLWLSLIGIILGAPLGTVVLQYMFDSNGDSMDYPVGAGLLVYLASAAFVLLISVLVSFMFNRRIKHLDMVEILKGIE